VNPKAFKRKLTAIFSADVAGYSRLMGEDEDATVRTLKVYRNLISGHIHNHRGRVVDSPGDNILAEFASVVDAVQCAVKIQNELNARNSELPGDKRMQFRIGVNLGDVIEDENRIYGDGVNIAARLESLAQAGGVCISGSTYEQVKNKLPFGYETLGAHYVKNITDPVVVYRVLMEPEAAGKSIGRQRGKLRTWPWVAAAAIAAVFVAAAVSWHFYLRPGTSDKTASAITKSVLPLTDRAAIAVLPFKNLSGDPEQEYFSDGITNDIITDLSKFRELLVIASNTVFSFKGKSLKVKDIGRELGVRYVIEGTVQKAGDKVRINAQLIDANTGHHLWAERYDRDLNDLFAIQDEIVHTIVATLAIKVDAAERSRAMRKDTDNLEAHDYALRGKEFLLRLNRSENIKAKEMFKRALELDSHYASAYVGLGWSYYTEAVAGWTEFPLQAIEKAFTYGQKALSIGEPDADTYALLGSIYLRMENYDLAINELQKAIKLNPNHALSYLRLGAVMLFAGQTDDAIQMLETGLRHNPYSDPNDYGRLSLAYYLKGNYEDAIRTLEQNVGKNSSNVWAHLGLAAAYAQVGRTEDANRSAEIAKKLHPFFEIDSAYTLFRNPEDRDKILDGLRKAGLKKTSE
jgi:adenylate cyclase